MSNCVEFDNPAVFFSRHEIDLAKLQALLASIPAEWQSTNDLPKGVNGWQDRPDQQCAWWYLQQNTTFEQGGCVIRFGRGRSSHTWRDFKGLLRLLQPLMLKPKVKVFIMRDEYDGFRSHFRQAVDFSKGADSLK